MLKKVKFVGIVTIRIFMETRSSSDFSGDRLTLSDIGVSNDDLQAELAAMKQTPDNVVQMSDYRPVEDQTEIDKKHAIAERKKKVKAIALAGAALLGTAKFGYEMFREKVHPAERIVSAEALTTARDIEITDVAPGDEIEVSPFSYTITGGNVRTSPGVDINNENLVNTDLSGKVITHPIEVADLSNAKNGDWFVFYDSEGQKFAVNEQNVAVVPDNSITETRDITVTVDNTTNFGIIAHDGNNISMQVATVVEVKS